MALQIKSSPSSPQEARDVADQMRDSIGRAIDGARIEVTPVSPGHFEILVESSVFADKSRVAQQQLVYGAIAHLMSGDPAPVHAIDRLRTLVP
jgi:acid stress-induced BolA-like protein IbaG/YrbA